MNKLAVIISAALAMASTTAIADVYVGGKIGASWLDDACLDNTVCEENSNPTLGAYLGYQAYDWLALELGYDSLGDFTGAGLNDQHVDAITFAPKFNFSVSEALALYVKAGGAYVDYGSKDDFSYLGAAGIEWLANENASLRLEYQSLTDINNDIIRAMANTVTLGLSYKFGGGKTEPAPVVTPAPVKEEIEVQAEPVSEKSEPEAISTVTETVSAQHLAGSNFANDSAELSAQAVIQLDELVTFLTMHPQATVEITGHTDSVGTEKYNQAMSEKRAQAVADVLVEKGIDKSRVMVSGEGETNPIASNETSQGRQLNRRVEIIIPQFEYQIEK